MAGLNVWTTVPKVLICLQILKILHGPQPSRNSPLFSTLGYISGRRRTDTSENAKMHGVKRFKDANNDGYSVTPLGKESLKPYTKLVSSHISREDFLGAGPILPLALSTSDT